MPYGPSVPHMFIVVFVIMLPTYLKNSAAMGEGPAAILAWQAGLAWAFIIGVIVLIGAFVGPTIRQFTPRAAMLGTLAGISITFIAMRPAFQMWEVPVDRLRLAWHRADQLDGQRQAARGIPGGLAAVIVGTSSAGSRTCLAGPISFRAAKVGQAFGQFGLHLPIPGGEVFKGPVQYLAAARHGHPARRLQFHRGHEQRRERLRRGRQLQSAQHPARRRDWRHRRIGARQPVPSGGLYWPSRLEGRGRTHRLFAGDRRRHRAGLLPRADGAVCWPWCRWWRSCRSFSTSAS